VRPTAPYASDPDKTRGRLFIADLSRTRSPFQRDRDRIIHSTAFRRLQHKTQVFLHHEGRHYRTRLTHTLEVSQIARSLARALSLDEDLAEAVALAHDLGHPPFGHAGERVLNDKMAAFGGFDHNMQAIRVVTRLESRYAEHDGLNLSWETLEGILKHNGPLLERNGQPYGRYKAEGLPFGWQEAQEEFGLQLTSFASLEAQAAAIADDIAYNAHDIDDALRAGLLHVDDLAAVPFVGTIQREVVRRWPGLEKERQAHEIQRRVITRLVENVIEATEANLVEHAPANPDAVRGARQALVAFSPDVASEVRELADFLYANVYRAEAVMQLVREGEAMIGDLFDRLLAAGVLPERWHNRTETATSEAERARIVCDFIAGMTDPYAIELYKGFDR
jgi:dGTPase